MLDLRTTYETLKSAGQKISAATDPFAEAVARKCTEVTGRQTSGRQIKTAAVRLGAIAAGFGGVMAMGNIVAGALTGPSVASGDPGTTPANDPNAEVAVDPFASQEAAPTAADFGDDFESQVNGIFAENGIAVHEQVAWVTDCGDVTWE